MFKQVFDTLLGLEVELLDTFQHVGFTRFGRFEPSYIILCIRDGRIETVGRGGRWCSGTTDFGP
jgi:hypothetical protein